MFKRILFSIGVFVFVLVAGLGVAYAAAPGTVQGAATRLTEVFVTNWPSVQDVNVKNSSLPVSVTMPDNQNVTITNPSPIPVVNSTGLVQWEYTWIGYNETLATINQLGSEGWEYVGVYNNSGNNLALFKRPIQ